MTPITDRLTVEGPDEDGFYRLTLTECGNAPNCDCQPDTHSHAIDAEEAAALVAALTPTAAQEEDLTRQSSPCPPSGTGSPRSPHPNGSEQSDSVGRAIVSTLRAVEDPYDDFEGNGEACRYCSGRRDGHHPTCVWAMARGCTPQDDKHAEMTRLVAQIQSYRKHHCPSCDMDDAEREHVFGFNGGLDVAVTLIRWHGRKVFTERASIYERLDEIRGLAKDWDSYGADPIDSAVIDRAEKFLDSVNVVPCSGGGVQLEWHGREYDIEVEFHPDGTTEVYTDLLGRAAQRLMRGLTPNPAPERHSRLMPDAQTQNAAQLLYALRQKRLVDGLNGRTWDASAHWLWEREIQAVEKRLGEADVDPLTERIGRGDMSSAEAAAILRGRR